MVSEKMRTPEEIARIKERLFNEGYIVEIYGSDALIYKLQEGKIKMLSDKGIWMSSGGLTIEDIIDEENNTIWW